MKLPIKREYFDKIKRKEKMVEFRDAHITFIAEDNGEELRVDVRDASVTTGIKKNYPDVLEDENTIVFYLK
jgi:hypothetical protein